MALYSLRVAAAAVPATLATILEVNPPANRSVTVKQVSIEFSGVSATDVPVIVEFGIVTVASAAGTVVTPNSMRDGQVAVGAAGKSLPATEGTFTVLETHQVPPSSGLILQYPLGEEPFVQGAAAAAKGFSIRANRGTGAAINATAVIEWEE